MANAVIEGRQGESMEAVESEMVEEAEETAPESIEEVVAAEEETEERRRTAGQPPVPSYQWGRRSGETDKT